MTAHEYVDTDVADRAELRTQQRRFPAPSSGSRFPAAADEPASGLRRALAILTVLGADASAGGNGVGVVGIAALVGREKSRVSRALKALAATGMVERDPQTRAYRLGWRLYTLAAVAADQHLLLLAPPMLRRLVRVVGGRAQLSILEAGHVRTLACESAADVADGAGWIGRTTPVHTTAAGRALLFAHADDEVRLILSGAAFDAEPQNAPRDVEDLLRRLHVARALGYVRTDVEFASGVVAVAAPVSDFRGRVVAALEISEPKLRLGRHLDAAGRHVRAAADALSRELSRQPRRPDARTTSACPNTQQQTRPPVASRRTGSDDCGSSQLEQ